MVTNIQYQEIKTRLSKTCSFLQLEKLKTKYNGAIASNRRLEECQHLEDFLTLLQKRGLTSPDDIQILQEIATILGVENVVGNGSLITNSHVQATLSPPNMYDKISDMVSRDIGYKWKEFARGLNIREAEIDNLESKFRDIPDRVREILIVFMRSCPEMHYRTKILKALHEARRKDLAYEVEHIMDHNNIKFCA